MTKLELTILETSDMHGAIFPIHYGTNRPANHGLGKLASYIKEKRRTGEPLLLIDNGDFLQGTPLASYYFRAWQHETHPMIKVMSHLGYDAAVLGNHEFNYGMAPLEKAAADASFPFLSCNILNKETGEPYFGKPYFLKEFKHNLKVAVIGVTTHYIPNWEKPEHIQPLAFVDAVEALTQWVPYIREAEQPDILVVSYHGGFEVLHGERRRKEQGENQAYRICREVKGIDILLTGHQHRIVAEVVDGVIVVQPGFSGEGIGQVTAEFEAVDGQVRLRDLSANVLQAKDFPIDEESLALVKETEEAAQAWLDEVIGIIDGDMTVEDPFQVRLQEHPLIELVNRVQMEAAGVDISCTALFNNEAPGLPEKVTMRDIVSNYVYPNSLVVIEVTGRDIKQALEKSASYFSWLSSGKPGVSYKFAYPKPQHYNYDMWEGIEYEIHIRKPPGERIKSLTYHGKPVKMDASYQVAMNNYRAGGGGEYLMFKGKKVIKEIQTDMVELLADYIKRHGTIQAKVNHNWKVLYS